MKAKTNTGKPTEAWRRNIVNYELCAWLCQEL